MLREDDNERPTAAAVMESISGARGHHIYYGSCCCDETDQSDTDSFRGSETSEDPGMSSQSHTRTTTLSKDSEVTGQSVGVHSMRSMIDSRHGELDKGAHTLGSAPELECELHPMPEPEPEDILRTLLNRAEPDRELRFSDARKADEADWKLCLGRDGLESITDSRFNTVLHVAASFKDEQLARDTVKQILNGNFDSGALNFAGNSALHYAAANGHHMLVKDLLGSGSQATVANIRKQTPIHVAARSGHAAVVKRLLQRCPTDMVDMQDDCGRTALHLACASKSLESLAALLEKGADPYFANSYGENAFSLFFPVDTQTLLEVDSLGSPALEDFVQDAVTLERPRSEVLLIVTTDDNSTCGCQVCKTVKALDGILDVDGKPLAEGVENTARVLDELLIDTVAFRRDAADCECARCVELREPPAEVVETGQPNEHTSLRSNDSTHSDNDTVDDEDSESAVVDGMVNSSADTRGGTRGKAEKARSTDSQDPLAQRCTRAATFVQQKPNTDNHGHATPGRYEGHDYWDQRIADRLARCCKCTDCRSRNEVAADATLLTAGFEGEESYMTDPATAWKWTMERAYTPASFKYLEAVVDLLLEHGADIEATDDKGRRMLHIAAITNNIPLSRTLIEHGAMIVVIDPVCKCKGEACDGAECRWAPLDLCEHFEMIRFLLAAGHSLEDELIAHQVVEEKDHSLNTLPILLAHGPQLELRWKGQTALQIATQKKNADGARQLIQAGALLNPSKSKVSQPLLEAIQCGDEDLVRLYLESGYLLPGAKGDAPLLQAASYFKGENAIMHMILDKLDGDSALGQVTDATTKSKWTALHYISDCSEPEGQSLAIRLVSAGADVNAKKTDGDTPLHIAARSGNRLLVELLLNEGADVDIENVEGQTALHVATQQRHQNVVKILEAPPAIAACDVRPKSVYPHFSAAHSRQALAGDADVPGAKAFATAAMKEDQAASASPSSDQKFSGVFEKIGDEPSSSIEDWYLRRGAESQSTTTFDTYASSNPLLSKPPKHDLSGGDVEVKVPSTARAGPQKKASVELSGSTDNVRDVPNQPPRGLKREYTLRELRFKPKTPLEIAICAGDMGDNFAQLVRDHKTPSGFRRHLKVSPKATPLHFATLFGEVEMARQLLATNTKLVDLEIPAMVFWTMGSPFHWAVLGRQVGMLRLFLETTPEVLKSLDRAPGMPRSMYMWWLSCTISEAERKDGVFVPMSFIAMVKLLIEHGWTINRGIGESRWTFLHYAVFLGLEYDPYGSVASYLCENGASPTIKDAEGLTPYAIASNDANDALVQHFDETIRDRKALDSATGAS